MTEFAFAHSRSVAPQHNERLRPLQLMRRFCVGKDHVPDRALLAALDQGYDVGDPLCDAWVAHAQTLPRQGMDLYQRALQHEIEIAKAIRLHRDGAYSFYLKDPDGVIVQVIHHPPIAEQALQSKK